MAIHVWNSATGAHTVSLSPKTMVFSFAFSPDGKTLAAAGLDMTLQLWDVAAGTLAKTLSGHGAGLLAAAFAPDGKSIATGADDGAIKIWDAETGALTRTLAAHAGGVWSLGFTPDGQSLYSGGGDMLVKRWDFATGALVKTLEGSDALAPSPRYLEGYPMGNGARAGRVFDVRGRTLGPQGDPRKPRAYPWILIIE